MKNWKKHFRELILQRGFDYYQNGAVTFLEGTQEGYKAIVEGSEAYEVEILLSGDKLEELLCTCPYAEKGDACKHLAAVFYQIEEDGVEKIKTAKQKQSLNSEQELRETINKISEKELKEFVFRLCCQDDSLRERILLEYTNKIDEKQIRRMKKEIDKIAARYADWTGFISYIHAWDYACALMDFLDEKVDVLINKGYLLEAFTLTNHVFLSVGEQEMDDSDGGVTEVAEACFDCWQRIVCSCDREQEREMFCWFKEQYQYCELDYMK